MKRKLLLFLTLCAVIDVSAQTTNLILNVSNTIEDGNIIRNVITLDERSTLPSNENLKFVVYRFFSGYNRGGEIAALIGTPIVSTDDDSGNTIYTFYMEGYQYWGTNTNPDYGDCDNLEQEFYTTNHPVIVKKANGQWDFTEFVLMDCFKKSTSAYHGTVLDYDNGGIYSYRMEMGAINVPSDGTKGVYFNNGAIHRPEQPNGTTSFTSNLVGVKLINPQINSQDQANSNVLTLGNTYTKDEVDADVDFSSENALKALTGDVAFNLVAKQTEIPADMPMPYPFSLYSNEIQEESIKSYHLVIYADDAQTVIYEKEQNVTESDGDILDQPELQWLTLLEQKNMPFSQGLLMDLEITTQNKYGKTNVYKAARIWLESTSMQVNYDHMLVSGKWNEPDGTKQGYQVTINTQGNWGGDYGNVNYPAPTVQSTYKWRVWRVTDTETKLIDFDNLEGKDWGASYNTSESGQGSSFSLTDIYVDKALGTGSTQSKKVKYVVRYYTDRYSKGVELPSSSYVIPFKRELTTNLSNPNQAGAPAVAAPAPANVQALAPRRAPAGYSDLNQYCVAEKQIEVEYTNEIPTGINELMAGTTGEVKQVRYYNVAGVESATPFDGLNIVVSHMADGSQKVTKIVR